MIDGREAPADQDGHAVAFFDEVFQTFNTAARDSGVVEHFYRIDGRVLRVRFAGSALVPAIAPALAHRCAPEAAEPEVTVCVWDTASTGCAMPSTRSMQQYAMRGELTELNTSRIYAVCERGYPSLVMFDRDRGLGLYWIPERSALPDWVKGAPLRILFHWWMGACGKQLVHGAAVATEAGGVLISARGGSGKSTSALAAVAAGMRYAGDDYVVIGLDPSPHVANLYCTAKIAAKQLREFPWLVDMVDNPGTLDRDKALVFLKGRYMEQVATGFPLRMVLVPRITGEIDTRLRPISAAAALTALAPTTMLFHPRGGDEELKKLSRLVRTVPTYALECGRDIAQIPRVISTLLE